MAISSTLNCPGSGGQNLTREEKFGDIESVKATSELTSPVSGEVVQANAELQDQPELINDDPYNKGWMLIVKLSDPAQLDELMDAEHYLRYLEGR